jgi:hypothetical protein
MTDFFHAPTLPAKDDHRNETPSWGDRKGKSSACVAASMLLAMDGATAATSQNAQPLPNACSCCYPCGASNDTARADSFEWGYRPRNYGPDRVCSSIRISRAGAVMFGLWLASNS